MKTILRGLHYLVTGPTYDTAVFFAFIRSFICGTKAFTINTYSPEALTAKLQSGTSLIRLGDGEAMLMTGRDIHYQKTSRALHADLRNIVRNQNENYILAIPIEALTASDTDLQLRGRFRIWRLFRSFAKIRLDLSHRYADAHCFYRQEYLQTVLPLLFANKHIICVSNANTLDETLKGYLAKLAPAVTCIESPSKNTYEELPRLTEKIEAAITTKTYKPLLVLSAGPASKVIAYHFAQKNVQSLDIGHGLEIVGRDLDYSDKI